jgi:hypothetical protein
LTTRALLGEILIAIGWAVLMLVVPVLAVYGPPT